jgi:multiple antibiotic resistance protein
MDWSELRNWDEYTKLLIGLLVLTDPISAIPVLGSLTAKFSRDDKKKIINISVFTFVITLFVILYVGTYILSLFGITIAAFKIAGGIVFLFYSLDMLGLIQISNSSAYDDSASESVKSIGVTPIGIPLLAGPGAISTIIIYGAIHASFTHKILVMSVILAVAAIIYLVFRISLTMGQGPGETTTAILNKIMGILLAAIAVEFILDGIVAHFPQLTSIH